MPVEEWKSGENVVCFGLVSSFSRIVARPVPERVHSR